MMRRAPSLAAPRVAPATQALAAAVPSRCKEHPAARPVDIRFHSPSTGTVTFDCGCVAVVTPHPDPLPQGERECRVCGCTDRNACTSEEGPCFWLEETLCSACAAAADHVVSMTIDWTTVRTDVATCRCGWSYREVRGLDHLDRWARMDAAIKAHWQAVVAEAAR